ncbi:MAG: DUF6152 family protein [Steroidobacteraceae bacterium]
MNMRAGFLMALAATLIGTSADAHHSYAAFDRTKTITLQGSVRTWELGNPHAYLWLYVANKKGTQDIWGMEAPSPTVLIARGLTKNAVKVGDKVTVVLNPLRDGRNGGNMVSLTLADGTVLDTTPNDRPKNAAQTTK